MDKKENIINKENIIKICFIAIFVIVISVIGVLTLMNNNEISSKEGRELNLFPKITTKNLMKDEFYTNYTNAFADQLEFRETFIKMYYLVITAKLNVEFCGRFF